MVNPSTLFQWNNSADWYDQNMGESGDALNKNSIRPVLLDLLGNVSGKTIVDIGCGSGYFTVELAKTAQKVIGTDFAQDFISICQKKYAASKNLSFQVLDVTQKMQFTDSTFDALVCKMVLQYVEDISLFAQETHRVLKPNGSLVIAVDHPFNTQFYFAQQVAGKPNPKYLRLENYFSRTPQNKLSLWGKVELTWYPKTIEDYIKPFLSANLQLQDLKEVGEEKEGTVIPRILLLKFTKHA